MSLADRHHGPGAALGAGVVGAIESCLSSEARHAGRGHQDEFLEPRDRMALVRLTGAQIVVALVGVALTWAGVLSRVGSAALVGLVAATATTVGAAGTLALSVLTLNDVAPELATTPPAAVPATFILSGVAMRGIDGLTLALSLRPHLTRGQFALLVAGISLRHPAAAVAIVPVRCALLLHLRERGGTAAVSGSHGHRGTAAGGHPDRSGRR